MLVTFIFTFITTFMFWNSWNSNLVDFSIDMPIFAPLPPQLRAFQINLKVWGSPSWWFLCRWGRHSVGGKLGWRFCLGRTGFPLMGVAWEETHHHWQKQIFQKPPLDALKVLLLTFYWRDVEVFKICKVYLRIDDRAIKKMSHA